MPQVLLLQPWIEDFYTTDCRIQPIGLAYLAASIKTRFPEMEVTLFDCLAGGKRRTLPWPKEFGYLRPFYGKKDKSATKLFHEYYRFGKSQEEIQAFLLKQNPILIGVSCLFTPYYKQSLDLASLCKDVFPDVPLVMGGNHATLHPHSLLRSPESPIHRDKNKLHPNTKNSPCDFVLPGEAETLLSEFLSKLFERYPALKDHEPRQKVKVDLKNLKKSFYESGLPIYSELGPDVIDIGPSPRELQLIPAFTGLCLEDYHFNNKPMTFLITSRSCPHRCSFCSIHAVFGFRYQTRQPQDVLLEIQHRYKQGIHHFDFEDDNLTFSKKFFVELLQGIIALKLPLTFSAMNGISYQSLDFEVLSLMKNAGFSSLNLSLVSSDQTVLHFSDRPHTLKKFFEVMEEAHQLGLSLTVYVILGMPGQTLLEMVATLKLLAAQPCLIGASPFYYTPGSPIHKKNALTGHQGITLASKNKDSFLSARLTAMDLETPDFKRIDIYTLFKLCRVLNYLKQELDQKTHFNNPDLHIAHPELDAALDCMSSGSWYAHTPTGPAALPFSAQVLNEWQKTPFIIRGQKGKHFYPWHPSNPKDLKT